MFLKEDKGNGYYQVEYSKYDEWRNREVENNFKKANKTEQSKINEKELIIAKELELESRIEVCSESEAKITIKSHKPNFLSNPTFRLIDPNKTNIVKIAKIILEENNTKLRNITNLNQWQSTKEVLKWFKNSQNHKRKQSFVQFDVVNFYPSITK